MVEGKRSIALVDTSCSRTIVSRRMVSTKDMRPLYKKVVMMNGTVSTCDHAASVNIEICGTVVGLNCLVADIVPGFDILLGMDAVAALGGVQISQNG